MNKMWYAHGWKKPPQLENEQTTIDAPALRYHGGKFRIADWVISHFPPHVCYVEPFCGAASVMLLKTRSEVEVINDMDEEIITFFRVLRTRPEELARAIELTPYSRREMELARESAQDDLEIARRTYVSCWQSWGSGTASWNTGWRFQKDGKRGSNVTDDWSRIDHLYAVAARLKQVFIECDDAFAVIERYDTPTTLFYVDPPYVWSTRSIRYGSKAYRHELTDDQHVDLARILHNVKGMVVLSGYESELYQSLYKDWEFHKTTNRTVNGSIATECIWISPDALRAQPQLRLWGE